MTETIGSILKQRRQSLKQSQVQVAGGICSQSMLSAIEHDHYIPNAQLLIALCHKLELALDSLSLAANYAISSESPFNDQVVELCNQHRYRELLALLSDNAVIRTIQTDSQTQAYYYYLAVAQLQATTHPDLTAVTRSLQLSLASATATQSTLTRLTRVTSACIAAKSGDQNVATASRQLALADIETEHYDENLNIVFYLAALTDYLLGEKQASLKCILTGIDFITSHDSHYMLANCYYLIAVIAEESGEADKQAEATAQSGFLAQLFKEQVYKI